MINEQRAKGERFRRLHTDNGTFLAPNAWNAGSARMLEAAGFPALSTTSGGIALSLGLPDYEGRLGRQEMMTRIGASPVPSTFPSAPISRAAMGRGRRTSPRPSASRSRSGSSAATSTTIPARPANRCSTSSWRRSASGPRAKPPTRPRSPIRLPPAPTAISPAMPIRCRRRSAAPTAITRPAPTASSFRASSITRRSWRWCRRSRRPSTSLSGSPANP